MHAFFVIILVISLSYSFIVAKNKLVSYQGYFEILATNYKKYLLQHFSTN